MLLYQIRHRVFKFFGEQVPTFPARAEINLVFEPLQAFGMQAEGGRTVVRGEAGRAYFDANTGAHYFESLRPLRPLEATISGTDFQVHLAGNILTVILEAQSMADLGSDIESWYCIFPSLLNLDFADPPIVTKVHGTVADVPYNWELAEWKMDATTTTQEEQEQKFIDRWMRYEEIAPEGRRRLAAAVHYFYVACRLERSARTPGEFLAEVLVNLAKVLEVLFPGSPEVKSRDAVRLALTRLGYDLPTIDRDFTPAMALRNEVGAGHESLALFKLEQLQVLHAYVERAESTFRDMLQRLLRAVKAGSFDVARYDLGPPKREVMRVIERLAEAQRALPNGSEAGWHPQPAPGPQTTKPGPQGGPQ